MKKNVERWQEEFKSYTAEKTEQADLFFSETSRAWKVKSSRFKESVEDVAAKTRAQNLKLHAYIESEQFEFDLDEFAQRIGKDGSEYPRSEKNRRSRIAAKCSYLLTQCQLEVGKAALLPGSALAFLMNGPYGHLFATVPVLKIHPKILVGMMILSGALQFAKLASQGYDVFSPESTHPRLEEAA